MHRVVEQPVAGSQPVGTTAPAVCISNLWKKYGDLEAVRGVSLEVEPGEIFGLIGPDGAGKTSTFQILGGVMAGTSGVTEIYGMPSRKPSACIPTSP